MKRVVGIVLALSALAVAGCMDAAEAKKELDAANNHWDKGDKAEAIKKYERVINQRLSAIDKADQPKVFQRVIEFHAEKGNSDAAKKMLAKALDNDVRLELTEAKAVNLLAKVKSEREDKKAEEQGRQARREEQEREQKAKLEAEQQELDRPLKVTAEDIFNDYEENSVNAGKKYRAKQRVEVTGTIENVGKVAFVGTPYVLLKPEKNLATGVQCLFTKEQADQLATLRKGERVTIKGRFQHKLGNVVVGDCELPVTAKASGGNVARPKGEAGKKLAAFQSVVLGWETYWSTLDADQTTKDKWAVKMEETQKAFIDIPFDPADNREEAKAMFDLYKKKLTKTGEMMRTLDATDSGPALEMAMWKRLSAHLAPIFKSVAADR